MSQQTEENKTTVTAYGGEQGEKIDLRKVFDPLTEKADERKNLEEQFKHVKGVVVEKAGEVRKSIVEMEEVVAGKAGEVRKSIVEMEEVVAEKAGELKSTLIEKTGSCRRSLGEIIEKHSHREEEKPAAAHDDHDDDEQAEKELLNKKEEDAADVVKENKVEAAKEWVVHKVEDFVDFIGVSPKNMEGLFYQEKAAKDLVEIIPPGLDKAEEVHEGRVHFQQKVEQARDEETEKHE
eukprot:CAMPEP_0176268330 /NCGR_PEP_ID=MMETSP0121_2-20121125/43618_1 /TAXON_ID=160619 /ORGANISM="Kryptoperidinium foliaceum, Strain CCMP 1326" /LENGTH=235 /DNA_ID=CAMNT_0017608419 /DNA_START=79 /DNA_END=787 /DNA_ORIENTATION=-